MYMKYFRSRNKIGGNIWNPISKETRSASGGFTKEEIRKLLEEFKIDLLGTISSQLDTLKVKNKQEEENNVLSIFNS